MRKIDLSVVKEFQEVPTIDLKPIKVLKDRVYFVKAIQNSKNEYWVDGIYCYYIEENKNVRIDEGTHTLHPYKFDIFVPSDDEDVQIYEDMNYIFFSIVTDSSDENLAQIILYAIDINTHEQIRIFAIKYSQREFYYMGFRMLSERYIAIDLVNSINDTLKEYDKLFIFDIYTKQMIEIQDVSIKYSLGIFQLSQNNKYIYCEEIYMDEEDEVSILTTNMYEVDDDDLVENRLDIFNNAVKYMDFEKFKEECINSNNHIDMKDIDSIKEDGIIRVIGSTKEYIYYKKTKHQKFLEHSKEFSDRIMLGKEEIYAINKNNMTSEKITNLDIGSTFSFENNILYKIVEDDKNVKIIDILTGIQEYAYEKSQKAEEFLNFIQNRYLIIEVNPNMPSKKYLKLIDMQTGKIEIQAKKIISVKDNFFYESR